jgi:hypothetical protein
MRTIVGFLAAPLVPGIVLECLRRLGLTVGGLEFIMLTYPVALVVGPLAYIAFRRAGLARLWHYVLGGFLGMWMVAAPLVFFDEGGAALGAASYGGLMGLLTASATATFWLIAVRTSNAAAAAR